MLVRAYPWVAAYVLLTGILTGPAWIAFHYFDLSKMPPGNDAVSYTLMAEGDYPAVVNPIHRYRLIVPAVVGLVARASGRVTLARVRFGFFVLNTALAGLAALLLYRMAIEYVRGQTPALLGTLSFLTSRDVIFAAGTPNVDCALYLVLAASFYALRVRSRWLLAIALLFGPAIKEQFIFFLPILLVYGAAPWIEKLGLAIAGGVIELAMRTALDAHFGTHQVHNLARAFAHLGNIPIALGELAAPHGWLNLALVFGPFWLVVAFGLAGDRSARAAWISNLDGPLFWLLPIVFLQMLLSGNLSRMAVLAFPAMAVAVASIFSVYRGAVALDRKSRTSPA